MSATASVRSKFYSEQDMIDDSAGSYYDDLAEQARKAAEENARESIIHGVHPRTGEELSLSEHEWRLRHIEAIDEEWHVFNVRTARERARLRQEDDELHDIINSQYPCSCCDDRIGEGWSVAISTTAQLSPTVLH